ncbi:hypothetical protein ACSBL2_22150 [Pedobacter sp. AW31-3R]|uniref:hypothetical protein n=1 Tax=Pedobacter sp. AW31-3R TaxID=3445781 RepID=UPI003FA0DB51
MENTKGNLVPDNDPCQQKDKDQAKATGLDNWNDRLDENLEKEEKGNLWADEKAKEYSAEKGSGDQSDASNS